MDNGITNSTICGYSKFGKLFVIFYKYKNSIQSKTLMDYNFGLYNIGEELHIDNFVILYEARVSYGNLEINNIRVFYEYCDFIIYTFDGTENYHCDAKYTFTSFEKIYTRQNLNYINEL